MEVIMVSKTIAALNDWLRRAEEVLQEQRQQCLSPTLSWEQKQDEWTVTLGDFAVGLPNLLQSLCERPGRWILIAEDTRRPQRFWQALCFEDGSMVAEVVSNRYLEGDERWTPWDEDRLLGLGWEPPEQLRRPNWLVVETSTSPSIDAVAGRAIETLRRIFALEETDRINLIMFSSPIRGDTPVVGEYAEPISEDEAAVACGDSGPTCADSAGSRWRAN
jgi:hypothetical protein